MTDEMQFGVVQCRGSAVMLSEWRANVGSPGPQDGVSCVYFNTCYIYVWIYLIFLCIL